MTRPLPFARPDRIAWGCWSLGAAGFCAVLARLWYANPSTADRVLILFGAGWAAWETARPAGRRPWPVAGLSLVAVAALLLPLGWFLLARVGPRNLLMWWQWAAVAAAAAGLLLARGGPAAVRAFAFPLLFPVFTLTLPHPLLYPLTSTLQEWCTAGAHTGLWAIGMEVERNGFILKLPSGELGVAEACSGIRSLTQLTALGGFAAYLFGFGPARGVLLVGLALPVVVAANVLRIFLSGVIQETAGPEYVQGEWHEALGFGTFFLGFGMILLEAQILDRFSRPAVAPAGEPTTEPVPTSGRAAWAAAVLLIAGIAGSLAAVGVAGGNVAAVAQAAPDLATIPMTLDGWTGRDVPVPHGVDEMLVYDTASYRIYTNNLGQELHVWVVYWAVGSQIRGRHDPDICWPSRGFERQKMWSEPVPACGTTIPVTARLFDRPKTREQQLVLNWSQDGRAVVAGGGPDSTSAGATQAVDPQGWVADLLGVSGGGGERLMVLVGTTSTSPSAQAATIAFTGRLATAVYDQFPWAAPEKSPTPTAPAP
ncbi:MAG: exosortase/archaeosortase family protein [Fimbriiglobus sp.]